MNHLSNAFFVWIIFNCGQLLFAQESPTALELHQIGQVFLKAGQPEKAMGYFGQSTQQAQYPTDAKLIAMNGLYRAVAIGMMESAVAQLDSSFNQVFDEFRRLTDTRGEYLALYEYGLALERQQRYDEAIQVLSRAMQGREKMAWQQEAAQSMVALARVYHEQGNDDQAIPYLHRAEQLLNGQKYPETQAEVYSLLHRIYLTDGGGDLAAAYRHKLLMVEHRRDEVLAVQQTLKGGQQAEAERQTLLYALDRTAQAARFSRRMFIAVVAILVLLTLLLVLALYKRQQKKLHAAQIEQLKQEQALHTAKSIMEMREQERGAIASHLHDEVGALIAVAKLNLRKLVLEFPSSEEKNRVTSAHRLLDEIGATVRHVSHGLMPPLLEKVGLKAAITEFIDEVRATKAVIITSIMVGLDDTSMWDRVYLVTLYRVLQELLTNALKHAHASRIEVQLVELEREVTLMVEDDGMGMPGSDASPGRGLELIRRQVEHYGGQLEIGNRHPRGTSVVIVMPLPSGI